MAEIREDTRKLVQGFMLSAGIVAGDRVPAEKVQDMLEQIVESVRPKRRVGTDFAVDGVVAARDKQPYVRLLWMGEPIVQLDMPQARQVAADIVQQAARVEADAVVVTLLEGMGLQSPQVGAFLMEMRDHRLKLDTLPTAEPRV